MKARLKISGMDEARRYFDRITKDVRSAALVAVEETAQKIRKDAIAGIEKISFGRVVKRRGRDHIVSKPGDPPNTDTGALVKSIKVGVTRRTIRAWVYSDLDYSVYLESVLNRPWLYPAYQKNRNLLARNMQKRLGRLR